METSAKSVSAAVTEDGVILASAFQCTGLTHSRTLMPMVEAMLHNADLSLREIDAFAAAAGPGSFTGLRIGIAALKGLAWAEEKPCIGVSTLEAMAENLAHTDALLICAMDARRQQIYNALFSAQNGAVARLCEDRAVALSTLCDELKGETRRMIVLGDGAALCHAALTSAGIPCETAPAALLYQNAVGVALAAQRAAARGALQTAQELQPIYLRPAQADRLRSVTVPAE